MIDRPPVSDSASRHSQYNTTKQQGQIAELLIEADRHGLHLVTGVMLPSVPKNNEEVRNG